MPSDQERGHHGPPREPPPDRDHVIASGEVGGTIFILMVAAIFVIALLAWGYR